MRDNEDFDGVQYDTFNDASAGFLADHAGDAGVMTKDEIRAEIRRRSEWVTGDASARAITGPQIDELLDMLATTDGEASA